MISGVSGILGSGAVGEVGEGGGLRRGGGVAGWEDVNYRDSWCVGVCIGLVLCIVCGSFVLCGCSTVALG